MMEHKLYDMDVIASVSIMYQINMSASTSVNTPLMHEKPKLTEEQAAFMHAYALRIAQYWADNYEGDLLQ